jgi:rhodanese-related sulfurtransferase
MKLFKSLATLLLVSAAPFTLAQDAGLQKLNRAQLDALLAKPESVLLIDVRRPDEITSIGGFAAYLSIQSKDLDKQIAAIPRDRTIVTVSNHAGRAIKAANALAARGFTVAGGVGAQDYEAEGGTLARIAIPAPKAPAATTATAAAPAAGAL